MLPITLVFLFFATGFVVGKIPTGTAGDPPAATTVTVKVNATYRGHTTRQLAAMVRHRTRQLQVARADVHRRWRPTVYYALRLASAVYGVPHWQLRSVGSCESHLYAFARNGIYRGVFQEGPMFERGPFAAFGVFDPIANALTAAYTVSREGWSQWECKP